MEVLIRWNFHLLVYQVEMAEFLQISRLVSFWMEVLILWNFHLLVDQVEKAYELKYSNNLMKLNFIKMKKLCKCRMAAVVPLFGGPPRAATRRLDFAVGVLSAKREAQTSRLWLFFSPSKQRRHETLLGWASRKAIIIDHMRYIGALKTVF